MTRKIEPEAAALLQRLSMRGRCPSCGKPGIERPRCDDCARWAQLYLRNAEQKRVLQEVTS